MFHCILQYNRSKNTFPTLIKISPSSNLPLTKSIKQIKYTQFNSLMSWNPRLANCTSFIDLAPKDNFVIDFIVSFVMFKCELPNSNFGSEYYDNKNLNTTRNHSFSKG
jgi:hypothetical protein